MRLQDQQRDRGQDEEERHRDVRGAEMRIAGVDERNAGEEQRRDQAGGFVPHLLPDPVERAGR